MSGQFARKQSHPAPSQSPRGPMIERLEPRLLLAADLTGTFADLPDDFSFESGASAAITIDLQNEGDAIKKQSLAVDFYAFTGEEFSTETAIFLSRVSRSIALPTSLPVSLKLPASAPAGTYRFAAVIDAANKVAEDNEDNNTVVSGEFEVVQPDYDLTVSFNGTQSLPAQIIKKTSAKGSVKVSITNPAESSVALPSGQKVQVSVFLRPEGAEDDSQDIEITAKQTLVSVSKLAPGKSVNATVQVSFPPTLDEGDYTVVVKVDGTELLAETAEDNNEAALDSQVTVRVAELDLTAVIGDKAKVPAQSVSGDGQAITLPVVVTNNGPENVPAGWTMSATVTARRLDDDMTVEVATFDNLAIGGLKSGASKTFNLKTSLPPGVPDGQWVLSVVIDSTDFVEETDEDNNVASMSDDAAMDVEEGFVDLDPAFVSSKFPTAIVTGNTPSGAVVVNVVNSGNVKLPTNQKVDVRVLLRPAGAEDDSQDILIGSKLNQSVSNLKAGAAKKVSVSAKLPKGVEAGDYEMIIDVQPVGSLTESDSDNNQVTGPSVVVADPFIDLAATLATETFAPSVLGGATAKASVTIQNQGNVPAKGTATVTFYATATGELDGSEVAVGQVVKSVTINPDKSTTLTGNVTMPDVDEAADLTIVAVVAFEPSNDLDDVNPDNNDAATGPTTVSPAFVDIVATQVTETLAPSVLGGAEGSATVTIQNQGNVQAKGTATVTFYATATGELDGSEAQIGQAVKAVTLNPNASTTVMGSVKMPNVEEATDFTIVAVVTFEPSNSVEDADPDNNDAATGPTTVSPAFVDIVATQVTETLAPSVLGGAEGSATVTIQNQGNVQAKGTATVTFYATATGELDGSEAQIGQAVKAVTLNPNASTTVTGSVQMPNVEEATDFTIVAVVTFEQSNGIEDTDTDNNDAATGTTTVSPAFHDLDIITATHNLGTNVETGDTGKATLTIRNLGNARAQGNVDIRVYLTESGVIGDESILIGQLADFAVNLNPNQTSSNINVNVTIPSGANGPYTIVAQVEPSDGSAIVDNETANNTQAVGGNVTVTERLLVSELFGDVTFTTTSVQDLTTTVPNVGRVGQVTSLGTFTSTAMGGRTGSFTYNAWFGPGMNTRVDMRLIFNGEPIVDAQNITLEFNKANLRPELIHGLTIRFSDTASGTQGSAEGEGTVLYGLTLETVAFYSVSGYVTVL